ncbi:MAG: hypothetical protein A2Z88_07090 [Omnitrophica WOR_2 bacterium GWA2_47_8]|nr:MAG: hypothetical protein A2Z88_07090 [Omnitrophica WOR_2 bacterium GWA2_47_8]
MLFEQSQTCEKIVIVKSGRVKIYRLSSGGQEQILEVLLPGDTCACNPGNQQWACSSSAKALSDCSVWTLERSHYIEMVKNNSRLMQTLTAIFAKKLCKFCSLIEQISLESPQRRLVKFLLDMLNSEEGPKDQKADIHLPFTHEEIAHRLGLARETVTRQLTNLKKLKLIQINHRQVTVCDRKALEKILA